MKRTNFSSIVVVLIFVLGGVLHASTTNIVSQDIAVSEQAPAINQNGADLALWWTEDYNYNYQFYLRFNYAFGDLSDATISLYLTDIYSNKEPGSDLNSTVTVYGLTDGSAGESFDETAMTWNNKAPLGTALFTQDIIFNNTPIKGKFPVGEWVDFQSEELANFIMASTNNIVSFAFVITGGDSWTKYYFTPRTWGKPAKLVTVEDEVTMGSITVVK